MSYFNFTNLLWKIDCVNRFTRNVFCKDWFAKKKKVTSIDFSRKKLISWIDFPFYKKPSDKSIFLLKNLLIQSIFPKKNQLLKSIFPQKLHQFKLKFLKKINFLFQSENWLRKSEKLFKILSFPSKLWVKFLKFHLKNWLVSE